MSERIKVKQMTDHVWLMDDNGEATGYLVVGSEKAAVIDTMNGVEDVCAVVRTITDLPVVVINTHGHCDHIFGNVYFDEAYIHPADMQLADAHFHFPGAREALKAQGLRIPPFSPLHDGDVMDLGGLTLQMIAVSGHTPGGICVLLQQERILFTGDAINRHLWMQLEESTSIQSLVDSLDRIMWVKNKADRILHGHTRDFDDISLLDELRAGAADLIACHANGTEAGIVYHWFGGDAWQHPFGQDGHSVICYDASKL